jgi:hypothetical protein
VKEGSVIDQTGIKTSSFRSAGQAGVHQCAM